MSHVNPCFCLFVPHVYCSEKADYLLNSSAYLCKALQWPCKALQEISYNFTHLSMETFLGITLKEIRVYVNSIVYENCKKVVNNIVGIKAS